MFDLNRSGHSLIKIMQSKWGLLRRTGMTEAQLKADLKISAIMIHCFAHRFVAMLQVIIDLVGSKDGSIYGERRGPNDPQTVALILTNPDNVYQEKFSRPRFGPGLLLDMMVQGFKQHTGLDLEYEQYGKPELLNYQFVEERLRKKAQA